MDNIQKFMTIRQLAKTGLISEHYLRLLEKQGKLPGIYAGENKTRKLVNVDMLIKQLDEQSVCDVAVGGE